VGNLYVIDQVEDQGVLLPTVASLIVPGLGQVLLGQYFKALWVFGFCAPLVMFCGLGNVLAAGDAYSIASLLRTQSVGRNHSSNWLIVPIWAWRMVRMVRRLQR